MRIIPRDPIQHAEVREKTWQSEGSRVTETLAIIHTGGSVKLPIDDASEMAWLRGEINAFLQVEV